MRIKEQRGRKHSFQKMKWIPLKLAKKSIAGRWEKSLAIYLRIKQLYKKPIIYNFSRKELAKTLGYTPDGLRPHLNKLFAEGLIYERDGNLCLIGVNKLKSKYKGLLVPVKYESNINDHIDCIRFTVIKNVLDTQRKYTQQLIEIIELQEGLGTFSKKEVKKILQRLKRLESKNPNLSIEKLIQCAPTLANETIALLINRNILTALKFQQNLNRLGLIKSIQRVQITENKLSKEEFLLKNNYSGDSSFLGRNNIEFYQYSNIILLPEDCVVNNKGSIDYSETIKEIYGKNNSFHLVNFIENETKSIAIIKARKQNSSSRLKFFLKEKHIANLTSKKLSLLDKEIANTTVITDNNFKTSLSFKNTDISSWKKAELTILWRYQNDPTCSYYQNESSLGYIMSVREGIKKSTLEKKTLY